MVHGCSMSKTVSADDLYQRSSQFRFWLFTPGELEEVASKANAKGLDNARERFDKAYNEQKEQKPEVFAKEALNPERLFDPISLQEERLYLAFFCQLVVQTCQFFGFNTQVKATAVSFFKKFYLENSVMDVHPKYVVYTAVFLAAKLENCFYSISSFCSKLPKTEPSDVLDLEFQLLSALKFTLLVHHPYRPLYGFFLDLQLVLLGTDPVEGTNVDTIGKLYDKAKQWLNQHYLLSDLSFFFTPPQIALAALYDLNTEVTDIYLKRKFDKPAAQTPEDTDKSETESVKSEPVTQYVKLADTIQRCIELAKTRLQPTREESTMVDKKCFYIHNPGKLIKRALKTVET